ncbi:hypothetical protein ATANTOWER_032689 [Ataeniobius toweri]|uniref:Uncharacterized protein n=1 Tax=Ataeniobius toweri TaxID=208326 RepID=A0ABU7B0B1_9TELE|nr:hypothetical protein [Ataeniobius toweri]
MSSCFKTCANTLDIKLEPWSDCTTRGKPNNEKNIVRAFTTTGVVIFRTGKTSGNRVDAHITVTENLFPALVLRNRPTQSINTRSKGSETAGMGCNGVGGIP